MTDPGTALLLAAIGGVGGKLAEKTWDAVAGRLGGSEEARAAALDNVQSLLQRINRDVEALSSRVERQDDIQAALRNALADPDFSYTVHQALIGGARTNNEARHQVLSRAVVERMLATPDSTQAVASALAVEVVGRLSGPQMAMLGLAALVYYIAPVLHAPQEVPEPTDVNPADGQAMNRARMDRARECVMAYLEYLAHAFEGHGVPEGVTGMDFAHLVSASCASFDRTLRRHLPAVLRRDRPGDLWMRGMRNSYEQRMPEMFAGLKDREALLTLWSVGLQHLTLTPAGLLIGSVVHQWKTEEEVRIRWDDPPSDAFRDDRAWDGERLHPEFLTALERHLEQELRRQVRSGR